MKVKLVPYDPDWPNQFQDIKAKLMAAIRHLEPVIEHVGSTSVPGLMAKPTIDIQIGMPSLDSLNLLHEHLLPHGFTRNSRWDHILPFRRFFVLLKQRPEGPDVPEILGPDFKGDVRSNWISVSNIHCVETSHQWFEDHLLFRDYLRQHPADRDAYAKIKQELAQQEWNITADYAGAKTSFIEAVKAKAKIWKSLADD